MPCREARKGRETGDLRRERMLWIRHVRAPEDRSFLEPDWRVLTAVSGSEWLIFNPCVWDRAGLIHRADGTKKRARLTLTTTLAASPQSHKTANRLALTPQAVNTMIPVPCHILRKIVKRINLEDWDAGISDAGRTLRMFDTRTH